MHAWNAFVHLDCVCPFRPSLISDGAFSPSFEFAGGLYHYLVISPPD